MHIALSILLVAYSVSSSTENKLELKPSIPTILDANVPAVLAFWEVSMMIRDPGRLPNTISRRSIIKEQPYRHFYTKLMEYKDDPDLKSLWECAKDTVLSMEDAKAVAGLIVPEEKVDQMAQQLLDLTNDTLEPKITDIRDFEAIKQRNPNYQPALIKMAKQVMAAVKSKCSKLDTVMRHLEDDMYMRPEDIKEDNAVIDAGDSGGGVDKGALIAMTVIGLVSVVVNVVQGVVAARLSFARQKAASQPLMAVSAHK